jgi:hypothetical protein
MAVVYYMHAFGRSPVSGRAYKKTIAGNSLIL